jgi:hypothetical protein
VVRGSAARPCLRWCQPWGKFTALDGFFTEPSRTQDSGRADNARSFSRLELSCRQRIRPRPINPWLYLGTLSTIAALILLELTSVDMDLANLFFDRAAGEFIGRHSYLLETILHDRVKQVVIA